MAVDNFAGKDSSLSVLAMALGRAPEPLEARPGLLESSATGIPDFSQLLENRPLSRVQVRTLVLIGCLVLMDGFDVQAVGFVAPALVRAWRLQPAELGPVFSAGLFGMLLGSTTLSLVADRVGRRPVLIGSTLFFTVCVSSTAAAGTVPQLIILRCLTGFGIGGVMANAVTLASEYCPAARRASLLLLISCGFTAGAMLGGVISGVLIPRTGWASVFIVGGLLPIVIVPWLFRELPESLPFLAAVSDRGRLRYWLARLNPHSAALPEFAACPPKGPRIKVSVLELFRSGRGRHSVLLWCISFANLLNLFFLSSWLPLLAGRMGYSDSQSVMIGVCLQLGGLLGALTLGPLIDRFGFYRVLGPAFALGAVTIAAIGWPGLALAVLFAMVLIAGACIVGGQPGINTLAACLYPVQFRATGVGWCLGIGRAGSIAGPVLAAQLLARNATVDTLFLIAAVPASLSALSVYAMSRLRPSTNGV